MTSDQNPMTNQTEEDIGRRQAVRIIHTRGTHYDIGFDIVRIQLFFFFFSIRYIAIYLFDVRIIVLREFIFLWKL